MIKNGYEKIVIQSIIKKNISCFVTVQISKVSKIGSALNVEWNDGEKSNFNFMWLRDNCPTAHDLSLIHI